MKKITIILLVLLYAFASIPVLAADIADNSVAMGSHTLDGQVPVLGNQQIVSNMKSAILYDPNSDTLMYAYHADEILPPSSLLKILTALIAVEKGNMTDVVTVREEVLATLDEDAFKVKLEVDEVLTVEDLLYCMMVGSGNDAAVILADFIAGNQQDFVAEMNRYAAEFGCTNTNFTNVHGLHDENQYTTARDVARILSKAIQNEKFCEVFQAKKYIVSATNKSPDRTLTTQNYLMSNDDDINYYDERVKGSRTALANDRSRSIASVAKVGDMELVCVVMGSDSQFEKDGYSVKVYGGYFESSKLLDLGFNGYRSAQILYPGQIVLQKSVMNGSSDLLIGTQDGAFSTVPENITQNSLVYRYVDEVPLEAPVEKGQRVSTLQIWSGNVCIAQTELYAMNSVKHISSVSSEMTFKKEGVSGFAIALYVIGTIVVIALAFIGVLSVLRFVRIARINRQRRRHSRYRRRSR